MKSTYYTFLSWLYLRCLHGFQWLEKFSNKAINRLDNDSLYLNARQKIGKYLRYEDVEASDVFSHVILCRVTGIRRSFERDPDDWQYESMEQKLHQKGEYFSYFEQDGIRSRCDEFGIDERGLMDTHYGMKSTLKELTREEFEKELSDFAAYISVDEYRKVVSDKREANRVKSDQEIKN